MTGLIVIWGLLRWLFALAGLALLVLTVTTLFEVFTVSIEGEPVAWYWLLIGAVVLGGIGQLGDRAIENSVNRRPIGADGNAEADWNE